MVAVVVALAFAIAFHVLEPFVHYGDDILALTSQWALVLVLLFGLLHHSSVLAAEEVSSKAIGILLLVITAAVVALAIVQCVVAAREARQAFALRRLRFRHRKLMERQRVIDEAVERETGDGDGNAVASM